MANRIDPKKKNDVLEFIKKYDSEHNGRGGQTAASKAYGITYRTINSWMKDSQIPAGNSDEIDLNNGVSDEPAAQSQMPPTVSLADSSAATLGTSESILSKIEELPKKKRITGLTLLDMSIVKDSLRKIEKIELQIQNLISEVTIEKRRLGKCIGA